MIDEASNEKHWESVRERRRSAQGPSRDLSAVRDALATLADGAHASGGDRFEQAYLAANFACDRLEAHLGALTTALESQRQATEEAMRRAEEARRELADWKNCKPAQVAR